MSTEHLHDLVGAKLGFCGVDNNTLVVVTMAGERCAFEVIEDECDGYRSMLGEIKRVPLKGVIAFGSPVATVTLEEDDDGTFDGYRLVDESGHVWLRFGTDEYADYYPCFAFRYAPPSQPSSEEKP